MKQPLNTTGLCILLLTGLGVQSAYAQQPREVDHKTRPIVATQITTQNFASAIRGSSAIAGVGDWMLSNGTLCASISDPGHETYLSYRGGTLVDLGFCGRNDDQWNVYHELFNLSRDKILPAFRVDAEVSTTSATLVVHGKISGVNNITRYRMDRTHPNELFIETRLTRVEKSDALDLFGSLILHPHRSLTPFVLSTTNPGFSKGFKHPFADTDNHMAMLKVMFPADLHVLVGADSIQPEISYGVQALSAEFINSKGASTALRQFAINDQEFTLLGNFTNPLWLDTAKQPGLLQFAQTLVMDLKVGESLLLKKRIMVSPKADVASITNQLYHGNTLKGETGTPEDRILITDEAGHPLTFLKPDLDNTFKIVLPENSPIINLVLSSPDYDGIRTATVDSNKKSSINLQKSLVLKKMPATLMLPKNKTMNLVFKGINGTPDPVFFIDRTGFSVGQHKFETGLSGNRISLAGVDADFKEVILPDGSYYVYATRGPEFTLTKSILRLKSGERTMLAIEEPKHVIETPGWMSADFHVHSEFSFDSTLPAERRVIDFVAQGGEIMVSTEHKRTINFQPIVQKLGLQQKIIAITGVELSGMAHTDKIPRTIGHSNVFPVTANDQQFMGGTLPHENRRQGEMIQAYKEHFPNSIFQLNHPRVSDDADDINYFNHLSIGKKYDSSMPLSNQQNASLIEKLAGSEYRDIDFDTLELLNGQDMSAYELVRQDWFSLLSQGYRKTATADSDSHRSGEIVALPRNYVHIGNAHDTIQSLDTLAMTKAVLRGDVFGTTGPILYIRLRGSNAENKEMGEMFSGNQGVLIMTVHAANWIPVNQLAVFINGKLFKKMTITKPGTYELPLFFDKDGFVTVEVEGKSSHDYDAVYPGIKPFAFSNPIFIDSNSDGFWHGVNNQSL